MKRTREQLRAELLATAEEVIDELLDWHFFPPTGIER